VTDIVHGAAPLRDREPILPRWWRTLDKWLLCFVLVLAAIGILLAFAASVSLAQDNRPADPFYYVRQQVLFATAAIGLMGGVSMLGPTLVRRLALIGFAMSLLALMALPIWGTDFNKGAIRWYALGFGSVQPSEFVKPMLVVVMAWLIAGCQHMPSHCRHILSLILLLVVVGFLVHQPDYGQAMLIFAGWVVMFFFAGGSLVLLAGAGGLALVGGLLAYEVSDHFKARIDGYLSGEVEANSQLWHALSAIREGGLLGVGPGNGQAQYRLPDAHTDFIIAVAVEEYGLFLALVIMVLYAGVVWRVFLRLLHECDRFTRLAGVGLVSLFCGQALINLGVAVRLLPAKGMTLPFISYGGSSLVASGITLGILLALTRSRPQNRLGAILQSRHERRRG